jgi:hypothetical protein
MRVDVRKNNKMFDEQYLRAKKSMSTTDVAVQSEHVTDKVNIGILMDELYSKKSLTL